MNKEKKLTIQGNMVFEYSVYSLKKEKKNLSYLVAFTKNRTFLSHREAPKSLWFSDDFLIHLLIKISYF